MKQRKMHKDVVRSKKVVYERVPGAQVILHESKSQHCHVDAILATSFILFSMGPQKSA